MGNFLKYMKKSYLLFVVISTLALSSCASIFCGSKAKVTISDPEHTKSVNITTDCRRYSNVYLPYKVKVKRGFSPTKVRVESSGYKPAEVIVDKKFNGVSVLNLTNLLGWGIDAATGAMMKPDSKYYSVSMERKEKPQKETTSTPQVAQAPIIYIADNSMVKKEEKKAVSRDNPGATELENTIIRWYLDSDPRGARVFWRVISSVPNEVKNTNETYLMTTPYEETRSFNILGLTYENSRDVTIEIKITKRGYEDQVKRFNVRQAIDQQEISSFFELVPKESTAGQPLN